MMFDDWLRRWFEYWSSLDDEFNRTPPESIEPPTEFDAPILSLRQRDAHPVMLGYPPDYYSIGHYWSFCILGPESWVEAFLDTLPQVARCSHDADMDVLHVILTKEAGYDQEAANEAYNAIWLRILECMNPAPDIAPDIEFVPLANTWELALNDALQG